MPDLAPAPRQSPERSPQPALSPADTEGVASAALDRLDAIGACLLDEESAGRPFDARPALSITIYAHDGIGRADAILLNPDEHRPEAERCLAQVFADATFEPPDHDYTVVWPIPF